MTFRKKISFAIAAALPTLAYAHGPQLQITRNTSTGNIETRQIVDTHTSPATNSPITRIYVMPMGHTSNIWYSRPNDSYDPLTGIPTFNSGPGLVYQYDTNVPGTPGGNWQHSGSVTVPNLQGTNFDFLLTAGLGLWNGSGFADPGDEQIQVYRGSFTDSATTIDGGSGGDMDFAAVGAVSDNPHSSATFRLLGDGLNATAASDDGVYLLSMQIRGTASGVNPSDEIHFLMYKNVQQSVGISAANFLATQQGISPALIQVVPEPGAFAVMAVGGLAALRLRRRH